MGKSNKPATPDETTTAAPQTTTSYIDNTYIPTSTGIPVPNTTGTWVPLVNQSEVSELRALVEQLQREKAESDKRMHEMMLTILQNQGKAPEPAKEEEPLFRIENTCGAIVAFDVTDTKTMQKVHVQLEKRGSSRLLTREQIMELFYATPKFFEKGYVAAPDVVEPTANVIPDLDAFLAQDHGVIQAHIEKVTAMSTLMAIYHHIENQRYRATDANGQPLLDKEQQPMMEEIDVDPKLTAVALQVQRLIRKRHNINASLTA